ncbi:lamin tail domain-containing protein [Nocardioides caeni]|uniref:LTD domain-containing protein n=1 Tax=Nocardioides caeni TaxID=574700 RepID=A0A4S8N7S6_9ACTN|nr:lamin tail domain-containing protein [Nocardioides caeni]THV10764.1 hypothetical protein E9934_13585 [Nocardioides caeni]
MRPHRSLSGLLVGLVGMTPAGIVLAAASPAAAADPASALGNVVINEVSSNGFAGGDFIELHNQGSTTVDLTGYHLKDNKTLAEDDIVLDGKLPPGGYAVHYVDGGPGAAPKPFGLGGADEATLLSPDGATVIDTYAWATHVTPSFARVPDGTGTFAVTTAPTPGGPNALATTAEAQVTLNEVFTDGAGTSAEGLHDYVEIHNGSTGPADLTGWYVTDGPGTPTAADRVTLGGPTATVPAGGYLAVETELMDTEIPSGFTYLPVSNGTKSGFGLNKTDWVFLHKPDGTLVSTTFKGTLPDEHANTWSRVHPGTGLWRNGADQTPGAVNTFPGGEVPVLDTPVVLNEVSNTSGQVELLNTGAESVDISGWTLLDSTAAVVHTVPAATTIAPGALHVATGITGLDSADSLTIRRASDLASVVAFTWFEDGIASYSRCELFGTVSYVETPAATFGAANTCPSLDTQPWPGASTVATVDEVNGFGDQDGNGEGDVSGAAFDPSDPSILWVVQNKNTLHKMHAVAGTYVAVDGWEGGKKLLFASGAGKVDSEGVTVGTDGSVHVTSERDNDNSGVSSNKIERYDVSGVTAATTSLTAVDEWDVNDFVTTGANLGLEGITYVPDSFLVDAGWEVGGAPYSAATHPTPGLFVTAVEGTGNLHFFSLAAGAAPVEVKVEDSGFPFSMDVTYDADRDRLWALCDDSCGGVHNVLDVVDGDFVVEASYARPAGMPNLNNEGMAIAPASTCADGVQQVVWTDDGDTDGFSLRAGNLPCPEAVASTALPRITGTAKVGFALKASIGSWSATPATATFQWLANGTPITGATLPTLKIGPSLVGKRLSVRVVVAAEGRLDGTATSTSTAAVTRGLIRAGNPRIVGTPKAGRTLTARAAAAAPAAAVSYQWYANGKALRGRTTRALRLTGAMLGQRIAVRVTYRKAGYATVIRTSTRVRVRR